MSMKKWMLPLLLIAGSAMSASAQKFGFVDTDYILSQMPSYRSAQSTLDQLSGEWQAEADKKKQNLDLMFREYKAEEMLLTPQQRKEREDIIVQKEQELNTFREQKFGYQGELFKKREELVKPIQDKVFEAVQKVAKDQALDFIFDKSSDLIMLYTNVRFDKSDEVLEALGIAPQEETKPNER
jgi:outer membrane protein